MAYIRSLSSRSNLLNRQFHHPSVAYIVNNNDDNRTQHNEVPSSNYLLTQQRKAFGGFSDTSPIGFLQERRKSSDLCLSYLSPSIGSSFIRHMSSSTTVGDGADKFELMSDALAVADSSSVVGAVSSHVPVANEVAVAAADSFFPVALLQHFIDAVHSFTGLNWWASIILTTLIIRGATFPLLINQLKATTKLTLMRPRLEEIKEQMQASGMDPAAVAEGQKRMQMLFKEYGTSPFTPLKGLFIQGPVFVSFFLAISNMAEKVPSFKNGGAFWFVDLTTPDAIYIFPVLTALTFWITVECNMQEGLEGNPVAGTMKNVSRVLAAATVPLTMSFPKAIFCYWITSNIFSFAYGGVLKIPGVKKFLGVPEIPPAAANTSSQSSFSLLSIPKQATAAKQVSATSSAVESPSKVLNQRISSSSVVSQKIRSLEKQVKGRKKNKK